MKSRLTPRATALGIVAVSVLAGITLPPGPLSALASFAILSGVIAILATTPEAR